jgi:hypothetical protein
MRPAARRALPWSLAVGLLGCAQILGFDHGTLSSGGLPCSTETGLASDQCDGDQLCMFGACGKKCASDGECPENARCLGFAEAPGNILAACVLGTLTCKDGCPTGDVCLGNTCRTACAKDGDCFPDQRCMLGGCVGTNANGMHDPGLSADAAAPMDAPLRSDAPRSPDAPPGTDASSDAIDVDADANMPPSD